MPTTGGQAWWATRLAVVSSAMVAVWAAAALVTFGSVSFPGCAERTEQSGFSSTTEKIVSFGNSTATIQEKETKKKAPGANRNNQTKDASLQITSGLRIVHLVIPFEPSTCQEPFCPLDQDQSVTFASMLRAQAKSRVSVDIAAVTFAEDEHVIPSGFLRLPPLNRSTITEYPNWNSTRKLPFVQDSFDRLIASHNELQFDYVVFTNSDIILHENFYNIVGNKINDGYDTFTINRRTIPKENRTGQLYTSSDLDTIYSLSGRWHPGFDCFVFPERLLPTFTMGNMFVGIPPVTAPLLIQLIYAPGMKYHEFETFHLKATYHLGDSRSWLDEREKSHRLQNFKNAFDITSLWSICGEKAVIESTPCGSLNKRLIKKGFDTRGKCVQWGKKCTSYYDRFRQDIEHDRQ